MMNIFFRSTLSIAAVLAIIPCAMAQGTTKGTANDKLMIVNGNNGHVIYDDGRDDMYCVTRRHTIGYDRYGNRVHARSMRCR